MRRAIRYGRQIGLTSAFLHDTAGVVFDIMRDAYPELSEASAFITNVIKNEEARFSETLDNGLKLLGDCLADLKARGITTVPGDVMFKLYDTYGFPVDIVQDVVRDEKISIDKAGFERAMEQQRAQSRSVTSFSSMGEAFKKLSADGFRTRFDGYRSTEIKSTVRLIVKDGQEIESANAGNTVEVVTESTSFYGAAGGQVGDTGKIHNVAGLEMAVDDTIKDPTGLIIHKGKIINGILNRGDGVTLSVDAAKRGDTARNHTATHILHSALRAILGDHVKQAGSMVAPDRLRFDFSHFSQVTAEEIESVEKYVNERIVDNVSVDIDEMDIEAAMASGATALFEEKYGDTVRVIALDTFSRELCGGTHAGRTGDVGLFKILGESSVASGVRRIEAVTGKAALLHVQHLENVLRQVSRTLKTSPEAVVERVEKTIAQQKALEKEVGQLKGRLAAESAGAATDEIKDVGGVAVLARKVEVDNPGALRDLADQLKDKIKSGVVVLGSVSGDKVLLVSVVTKDLTKKLHAGKIVKQVAGIVGGGGGGRPDMAQAGGSKPEKLDEAIDAVYGIVSGISEKVIKG
jgi:alanyl-tRNA synthetase